MNGTNSVDTKMRVKYEEILELPMEYYSDTPIILSISEPDAKDDSYHAP